MSLEASLSSPSRFSRASSASTPLLSRLLGGSVSAVLHLVTFLLPVWFLPQTLDAVELNKQTLLVVLSMLGLTAWLGKALYERRLTLTRSWLHLAVLLFGAGYLLVSLAAPDRYLAFAGNIGQMSWAFVTIFSCIVLYLLLANTVSSTKKLYDLLLTFLGSSVVVGVFGLLQMDGVHVFGSLMPVTASTTFNSIGSTNALAVFLSVPLLLAASLQVLGCKDRACLLGKGGVPSLGAKILVGLSFVISLIVAFVVDYWVVWATVLFGCVVLLGLSFARNRRVGHPAKLVIPGVLALISVALLIWQTPMKWNRAVEVAPSASHSWQIAQRVLTDRPFFGQGPGAWIYAYSQYRAPTVNLSQFWSVRFDRGFSVVLTLLATIGIVGTALWLLLVISGVAKSASHVLREADDDTWQAYLTVFTGWSALVFIAFVYNFSLAHQFAFWFLFGLLAALVARERRTWNAETSPRAMVLVSLLIAVFGIASLCVLWVSGQRLVAEMAYSRSVSEYRAGKAIESSIAHLTRASSLNRLNDVYDRNLSQAYLLRLNQVMNGPNTPEKSKLLRQIEDAALSEAKIATEKNPYNVDNWSNAAVVFESVQSFTPGADEIALKNFEEAVKREPVNPIFYNEMGKIHILRADAFRTKLSASDEKTRKDAQASMDAEFDKAAELLEKSIQLKGDFAPAHYNLGVLYEREGKLKEAILKMEQLLATSPNDVGVGFQLAILYARDGQKAKALNLFEQIVAVQPDYANARWYLSALYEEAGRYDDAIAQVNRLLELNVQDPAANQRLDALVQKRLDAEKKSKPPVEAPKTPLPEPLKEEIKKP